MNMINSSVSFYKLNSIAKIPRRSTVNAAGWDLYAIESKNLNPWSRTIIGTGIALEMPDGIYGRIASRSSFALKGLDVGAGVIDPDFHGEVKVLIINNSNNTQVIKEGERFSQIIFEPFHEPKEVLIFKHGKEPEKNCKVSVSPNSSTGSEPINSEFNKSVKVMKTIEQISVHMAKPSDGISKFYLYSDRDVTLQAGERAVYPTNIGLSLPENVYAHLIGSRLLADFGVDVIESIIKKNASKEINIILHNRNNKVHKIVEGLPVAQIHFKSYVNQLKQTTEAPCETSRNASGFGSTGNE